MKTRKLYLWVIILIILGVLLAACGKSATTDIPATSTLNSSQVLDPMDALRNAATQTAVPQVETACQPPEDSGVTAVGQGIEIVWDYETCQYLVQLVNIPTSEPVQAPTEIPVTKSVQELFSSPVETTDTFNEESAWMIAEPGVILDNTTAWVIPSVDLKHYANVPEGGFAYFSLGQGKIVADGVSINLPHKEGHNYLVLIRGRIDDVKVDTDLNLTAEVTEFVPGHAIWSYMPKGAYVSKGWFLQQMVASTTESFTNCGALGCSQMTIVLFDVDSHTEQRFAVKAESLTEWTVIK